MFIPLHDANGLRHIKLQYVTIGLIAVNVIVFLSTSFGSQDFAVATSYGFGFVPSVAFDRVELPPELHFIPDDLSFVTYAFLHADLFHLGGNMVFLWVFGDNIEDAMGHLRFLLFYLLCAIGAAFFHGMTDPASEVPLIGASGAIAGIVSAYLILHPRVKVWVLAFARIPLRIPAWIALSLWILLQVAMFLTGGEDRVSWACHVGGIMTGAVLVLLLRRRDVPLFDREVVTPNAVEMQQQSAVRPIEAKPVPRWGRQ